MPPQIPDWFWIMFVIVLVGMIGLGYQVRRVEKKIDALWDLLNGPHD